MGVTLFEERLVVPQEIRVICGHFAIGPLISINEGTRLIAATPERTPGISSDLKHNGIAAWDIGEITAGERLFVRKNSKREELKPVAVDPFWTAYFSTLEAKSEY